MAARRSRTGDIVGTLVILAIAGGCAGKGCSCLGPTPGGFPAESRQPNALEVRVTPTAISAIEANPAALVGNFLGTPAGQPTQFAIPPQCAAAADPKVCCDGNGNPTSPCGPVNIDLAAQAGDAARLEVNPATGAKRVDLVVRARVATAADLPIIYQGVNCTVGLDSTAGNTESVQLAVPLNLTVDGATNTTRLEVGTVALTDLENADITLSGGALCFLADVFLKGFIRGQLTSTVEGLVQDTLAQQFCKPCQSGSKDECGSFADACTNNVCMRGDTCLQELGLAGRLAAAQVFGGFSPGLGGALDLYEVAGGYTSTNSNGISLGLLSGMLPAATPRDLCGPPAAAPAPVAITPSTAFAGNTRPDTGAPYGLGLGLHASQLDQLAWAAYQGGFLCLSIGTEAVPLINSDTLAVAMPSLIDLLHGESGQMVLGLRPQRPPTIALGLNTFVDDGSKIDDPLLDIRFQGMAIDVFAMVDDQFIRVLTMTTDVHLPLNLDVDATGGLLPVIGSADDAFANVTVTDSDALTESKADLEARLPALLAVALPQLGKALGAIALPKLGPLALTVQPGGITAVDDKSFLAIYADVALATAASLRVDTRATIAALEEPGAEAWQGRYDRALRPTLALALGGQAVDPGATLEWSFRLDDGLWSPYGTRPDPVVSSDALWLQARHTLEVRAREVGRPLTTDPSPVVLHPIIDTQPPTLSVRPGPLDQAWLDGHDNVSRALRVRARVAGGAWRDLAALPAPIDLAGHELGAVEAEAIDEAGNHAVLAPPAPAGELPEVAFHGKATSGCSCQAGGERGAGVAAALCLAAFWFPLRRRRRRSWWLIPLLAALALGAGCSCGSSSECQGGPCQDGEVVRGPTGRYSSIAVAGDRAVVAAYEQSLGDLVLGEIGQDGVPTWRVVDGVPADTLPTFKPDGYRGGVTEAGPDVGTFTSVALQDGFARIAYVDRDRGALRYARETADGFELSDVEVTPAATRSYASLAIDLDGRPAIAFLASDLVGDLGSRASSLRLARATTATPTGPGDWDIVSLVDRATGCAGLCGDGDACLAATDTVAEHCAATTADCTPACSDKEACQTGACVAAVPPPKTHELALGAGLFARLRFLPDGSPAVVYYDRTTGDLMLHIGTSGSAEIALDASAAGDTGMFASAEVDAAGALHVAYQDALGDQLLYLSYKDGATSPVEVVDDGVRPGESRTHAVGAGAALFLGDDGEPAIAYQDGATSDIEIARRAGGVWTREDLLVGPELFGFYINVAHDGARRLLSTYYYDRSVFPPGDLMITADP